MKEDKRGSMYATKRKLHNLLQAATGGGSTTAGTGSADKESTASTVSKTLSRFRSKSTANLPKPSPKEGESDEDATVLRPPRTAGGHETTASASQIELVLAGAGVTGTSIVGASTSAEDLADEELRKKRNKVTVAPVSLSLLEKDRFSLSIRPSSPSAGSPIGSIPSRASTIHVSEKPTPAYAPWDRAQFLDRLRTYRFVDKWSVKPPAVNEVEWSRRGWVCVDKNRVRCTVCAKEVVVKVDADGDEMDGMEVEGMEERINERETTKAIVSRYQKMIIDEHEDYCLWRKRGCDDTIYHLPLANPTLSRPAFFHRYKSLITVQRELPPSLSFPPELSETDYTSIIHGLYHNLNKTTVSSPNSKVVTSSPPPPPNTPASQQAFLLALFGWQSEEPSIPSLLTCSACFRRLGLWLFKQHTPLTTTTTANLSNTTPTAPATIFSVDNDELPAVSRLDVVGEHRDYCPWINGRSQSQGREPGSKILLRVLQQSHNLTSGHHHLSPSSSRSGNHNYNPGEESPSRSRPSSSYSGSTANATSIDGGRGEYLSLGEGVGGGGSNTTTPKKTEKERDAETNKMEGRLKRLKSIYFNATSSSNTSSHSNAYHATATTATGEKAVTSPMVEKRGFGLGGGCEKGTATGTDGDGGGDEAAIVAAEKKKRGRSKSLKSLKEFAARARSKSKGASDKDKDKDKDKEKEKGKKGEEKEEAAEEGGGGGGGHGVATRTDAASAEGGRPESIS